MEDTYVNLEIHYVKSVSLIKFVYTKKKMNKKILGIGNAIIDVFAKVEDDFLIKRNFIKSSMKLIDKSEFEDLKKNIKIEKIVAGGSVANTMAGIAYLKGGPSFIGKIPKQNSK